MRLYKFSSNSRYIKRYIWWWGGGRISLTGGNGVYWRVCEWSVAHFGYSQLGTWSVHFYCQTSDLTPLYSGRHLREAMKIPSWGNEGTFEGAWKHLRGKTGSLSPLFPFRFLQKSWLLGLAFTMRACDFPLASDTHGNGCWKVQWILVPSACQSIAGGYPLSTTPGIT